jgi:SAM-dependent methyltransferase
MITKVDYAQQKVAREWDTIWSLKNVADEERNIDKYIVFFNAVEDILRSVPSNGIILEGGCGLGRWLLYHKDSRRIVELDYSLSALSALKAYQPESRVCRGDVTRLPIASNSVDCYLSFGVLEHFEGGPDSGPQEAYRVLKPDGTLLISGPGATPQSASELLRES